MPFVDIGLYYLPVNQAPISPWQSTVYVLNLDLNLILPLFFILKMLSALYNVYWIYLNALQKTFSLEANTVNSDQFALKRI